MLKRQQPNGRELGFSVVATLGGGLLMLAAVQGQLLLLALPLTTIAALVPVLAGAGGGLFFGLYRICVLRRSREQRDAQSQAAREVSAQQALVESEERYRQIIELSPDPVVILQDGRYRYVSPAFSQAFGYASEEAINGLSFFDLVQPQDIDAVRQRYEDRLAGNPLPSTYRIDLVAKDGALVPCETSASRIDYEGRPADLVIIRDISERVKVARGKREAEQALVESEERYRLIFDHSPLGIVHFNPGASQVDGNERFLEIIGATREQVMNFNMPESLRDPAMRDAALKSLAGERGYYEGEYRAVSSGKAVWVRAVLGPVTAADGSVLGCVGIFEDIGEQKRIERALRESQQRYRVVTELSPVAVYQTDADGNCLYANERWLQMTGFTMEQTLGQGWSNALHPEDRERIIQEWTQAVREGRPFASEYRLLSQNGDVSSVFGQATAERDDAGEITGFVGTLTDITKRNQAEEALRQSEERYRTTLEHMADGIHVVDENLNVLLVNSKMREWCEETGLPFNPEASSLFDAFPFLPRGLGEEYQRVMNSGKALRTEIVMPTPKQEFVMEVNKVPIIDRGRVTRVVTIVHDVTKRKQAEQRMRQAHAHMTAMLENTDDCILISDRNALPLMFNTPYAKVIKEELGLEMKPGIQPHKLLPDPAAVAWWDGLHRRVLSGEKFKAEYEHSLGEDDIRHFEISFHPILEEGAVTGFTEFTQDITERKRAEIALRESEERFRVLVERNPYGIQEIDRRGTIAFANNAHHEMYGLEQGGLVGRSIADFLAPGAKRDEVLGYLASLVRDEPPPSRYQQTVLTSDGKAREIEVNWNYLRDAKGGVSGFLSVLTDITERKQAEEAVMSAIEREQRRIGLDLHDGLIQQLTGVRVMGQLLERRLEETAPEHAARVAEITGLLGDAVAQVRRIVQGLYPVGLETDGIVMALRQLAANTESLHDTPCLFNYQAPVEWQANAAAISLGLESDTHLYRIAQEALGNAVRHAQASCIEITFRVEPFPPSDDQASGPEMRVELCIRDDGVGLPEPPPDRDAAPAASADRSPGLGLRSMQYRANQIGASLEVSSRARGGVKVVCTVACIPHRADAMIDASLDSPLRKRS